MVVCHITEGAFDGTVSWITNPTSQVSYHFVVARDGRIVQAVDICNTAWANGTTRNGDNRDSSHSPHHLVRDRAVNANLYSVSIGFEGRLAQTNGALTTVQLEAGVWLIRHIQEEIQRLYSVRGTAFKPDRQHIVGHHEITPRTRPNCPGPQFPFDAIVQYLHARPPEPIEPEAPCVPPDEPLPPTQQLSTWAQESWTWGVENSLTDGTNPRNNATREQMLTLLFRYHHQIRSQFSESVPPAFSSGHEPSGWAQEAWAWGIANRLTDGTNPQATLVREQMMQMLFNYHRFMQ